MVIDDAAVLLIPCLGPLVEALEFPGGWELEFHDLQRAAIRVESVALLTPAPPKSDASFAFQRVADHDPRLALAGLRIKLEKRLSLLAQTFRLNGSRRMGTGQLLRPLTDAGVLSLEESTVLAHMTALLNSAVHGARVDRRAADWAIG